MLRNHAISAPDEVRDTVRSLTRMQMLRTVAAWRPDFDDFDHPATATRIAMRSLARRILDLNDQIASLNELIEPLVLELGARLLERPCIGIETAGQLLVTVGDNADRLRSEAAWAMLCGVAPLPASSGKTTGRHRLNRGGDRQANRALHIIVISRLRTDEATRAFAARKTTEGISKLETIRCLKRYVAREVYPLLTTTNPRAWPQSRRRSPCTGGWRPPIPPPTSPTWPRPSTTCRTGWRGGGPMPRGPGGHPGGSGRAPPAGGRQPGRLRAQPGPLTRQPVEPLGGGRAARRGRPRPIPGLAPSRVLFGREFKSFF